MELQNRGAANVNIVSGSHAVPALVQGIRAARQAGLNIPVLWNSSGYESIEALELLNGLVDFFLPDLKTLDSALAQKFFNAPDYPRTAQAAILKMLELNRGGASNVIIRHLILPGCLDSTKEVLRWFAENANGRALLSLMSQYTPVAAGGGPQRYANKREYETVLGWLEEYGIADGFCQELAPDSAWLPDFARTNPFLPELAAPVWHWRDGFT
jgi:putative pyruvate formate lyase activating enzyme